MQPFVCFVVEQNHCYAVCVSIQQNLTGRNARGARIHVTIPFLARSSGVGGGGAGGQAHWEGKAPRSERRVQLPVILELAEHQLHRVDLGGVDAAGVLLRARPEHRHKLRERQPHGLPLALLCIEAPAAQAALVSGFLGQG